MDEPRLLPCHNNACPTPPLRPEVHIIASKDSVGIVDINGGVPQQLWQAGQREALATVIGADPVLMSARTLKAFGAPPGGRVLVLSRKAACQVTARASVVRSVAQALDDCARRGETRLFVLGGVSVFAAFLPLAVRVLCFVLPLRIRHASVDAVLFFPKHACTPVFADVTPPLPPNYAYGVETYFYAADSHDEACAALALDARATFDMLSTRKRHHAPNYLPSDIFDHSDRDDDLESIERWQAHAKRARLDTDLDYGSDAFSCNGLPSSRATVASNVDDKDDDDDELAFFYDSDLPDACGNDEHDSDVENDSSDGEENNDAVSGRLDKQPRFAACMVARLTEQALASCVVSRLAPRDALALSRASCASRDAVAEAILDVRDNPCAGLLAVGTTREWFRPIAVASGIPIGALYLLVRVLPRIQVAVQSFHDCVQRACRHPTRAFIVSARYPRRAIERAVVWASATGCGAALSPLIEAAEMMRSACVLSTVSLTAHAADTISLWLSEILDCKRMLPCDVTSLHTNATVDPPGVLRNGDLLPPLDADAIASAVCHATSLAIGDIWMPSLTLAHSAGRIRCASLLRIACALADDSIARGIAFTLNGAIVISPTPDTSKLVDGDHDAIGNDGKNTKANATAFVRARAAARLVNQCMHGLASRRADGDPPLAGDESQNICALLNIMEEVLLPRTTLLPSTTPGHDDRQWEREIFECLEGAWWEFPRVYMLVNPEDSAYAMRLVGSLMRAIVLVALRSNLHPSLIGDGAPVGSGLIERAGCYWWRTARAMVDNSSALIMDCTETASRAPGFKVTDPLSRTLAGHFFAGVAAGHQARAQVVYCDAATDATADAAAPYNILLHIFRHEPGLYARIVAHLEADEHIALALTSRAICAYVCAIAIAALPTPGSRVTQASHNDVALSAAMLASPTDLTVSEGAALVILLLRTMPALESAWSLIKLLDKTVEMVRSSELNTLRIAHQHARVLANSFCVEPSTASAFRTLMERLDADMPNGETFSNTLSGAAGTAAATGCGYVLAQCETMALDMGRRVQTWRKRMPRSIPSGSRPLYVALIDWADRLCRRRNNDDKTVEKPGASTKTKPGIADVCGQPPWAALDARAGFGRRAWMSPLAMTKAAARARNTRMLCVAVALARHSLHESLNPPTGPQLAGIMRRTGKPSHVKRSRETTAAIALAYAVVRGIGQESFRCGQSRTSGHQLSAFLGEIERSLFSWPCTIELARVRQEATNATLSSCIYKADAELVQTLDVARCLIFFVALATDGCALDADRRAHCLAALGRHLLASS